MFFGKKDEVTTSPDEALKQRVKQETTQEIALADITELVNNMTKACYDLCYQSPGSAQAKENATCTEQCATKYMTAWNIVSQAYANRLK